MQSARWAASGQKAGQDPPGPLCGEYLDSSGSYGRIEDLFKAGLVDERLGGTVAGYGYAVVLSVEGHDCVIHATSRSRGTGEFSFYSAPEGVVRYSMRPDMAPRAGGRTHPMSPLV